MKNFFWLCSLFFLSNILLSCSVKKICYDYHVCKSKIGVVIEGKTISEDTIRMTIQNLRNIKIVLTDTLYVLYFKYNQNLRSPYHDAESNESNKITEYVPQYNPITIVKIFEKIPIILNSNRNYFIDIAKSEIIKNVEKFGNLDTKYQLVHGFQVFVKSSDNKHRDFFIASNIFNIINSE